MLDPDLLRTFVAIAETGSFTEAAARVHRTQSAVSMQMKRLEDMTGKRLFEKAGRGVVVSRDGDLLLPHARKLLRAHQDVMAALQDNVVDGKVRIGAPDDYASTYLPASLTRFSATHPRVEVELVVQPSSELLASIDEEGGVDLALVTQCNVDRQGLLLAREPLVWVTAAGFDAHERDPLPLAVYHGTCAFRSATFEALASQGRTARVAYSTLSMAGIRAAVSAGLAVSTLLRPTVPDEFRILGERDGFPALPSFGLLLIQATSRRSPAAEALAAHVVESFRSGTTLAAA